jgi:hypothetical protein
MARALSAGPQPRKQPEPHTTSINQPLGCYQRANEAYDWFPVVVWMQ